MEKSTQSFDSTLKQLDKLASTVIIAVETEDELGTVLRLHWLVESMLTGYLTSKRQGEIKKIVKEPRDFGLKLSLATAFGMPLPIAKAIYQINVIRNKLAHAKSTTIEKGDLQELTRLVNNLKELHVEFTPLEKRYVEMPVKNPGEKFIFGDHNNRIDFIIACFGLYGVFIPWYSTTQES